MIRKNMELQISNSEMEIREIIRFHCPVCRQGFASDKSLYGHMRNHPKPHPSGSGPTTHARNKSGFDHVPQVKADNQAGDHKNAGHDLLARGWSRTGRRRRHGKAPMRVSALLDDEKQSVADDGACGRWAILIEEPMEEECLPPKKRLTSSIEQSSRGGSSSQSHIGPTRVILKNKGKQKNPCPEERKALTICGHGNSHKVPFGGQKTHAFGICDKSFNGYQALRGLKTYCHGTKDDSVRYGVEDDGSLAIASDSVVVYVERPREDRSLVYRCPFCDKVFRKFQALGGHKRHCRGHVLVSTPVLESEVLCLPSAEQETRSQSRVIDFDLNELPPELISSDIHES